MMPADEHGERLARMETMMDTTEDRIERLESKVDAGFKEGKEQMASVAADVAKIAKFSLLDPRGIVILVSLILGGSGFGVSMFRGDSPEQAAKQAASVVQTLDPFTQALLDKLAPAPAVPQDPYPVDPRAARPRP